MGRTANLSPMGLFNWDSSIFDLLELPSALDRETLINNLLAETAELEVLYPNPVVFKNLLGIWSHKEIDVWNRLWETTQYEYNPIENYNRYETGSQTGNGSSRESGMDSHADTTRQGGMDTHADQITHDGSDTVTGEKKNGHWIAGYDSTPSGDDDGLVKQTRDEENVETTTEYGAIENRQGNVAYGKTENKNGSYTYGKNTTTSNDGQHELHAHGNIGVTTTQKLIIEQRDIDKFNLYDIIIEDFKMRFCILVY